MKRRKPATRPAFVFGLAELTSSLLSRARLQGRGRSQMLPRERAPARVRQREEEVAEEQPPLSYRMR